MAEGQRLKESDGFLESMRSGMARSTQADLGTRMETQAILFLGSAECHFRQPTPTTPKPTTQFPPHPIARSSPHNPAGTPGLSASSSRSSRRPAFASYRLCDIFAPAKNGTATYGDSSIRRTCFSCCVLELNAVAARVPGVEVADYPPSVSTHLPNILARPLSRVHGRLASRGIPAMPAPQPPRNRPHPTFASESPNEVYAGDTINSALASPFLRPHREPGRHRFPTAASAALLDRQYNYRWDKPASKKPRQPSVSVITGSVVVGAVLTVILFRPPLHSLGVTRPHFL
jgi:hypothetical protein